MKKLLLWVGILSYGIGLAVLNTLPALGMYIIWSNWWAW